MLDLWRASSILVLRKICCQWQEQEYFQELAREGDVSEPRPKIPIFHTSAALSAAQVA